MQCEVDLQAASFNAIQIKFYKSGAYRLQIAGLKFNRHPVQLENGFVSGTKKGAESSKGVLRVGE